MFQNFYLLNEQEANKEAEVANIAKILTVKVKL